MPEQNIYHPTHERFAYDEKSSIQWLLARFVRSCQRCDELTHFGHALVCGGVPELIPGHALARTTLTASIMIFVNNDDRKVREVL